MKKESNIAIIVGTRPEIIKMSPVIRLLEKKQFPFFIIHSNQHYSKELDEVFFKELNLPRPTYNLGIGSAAHGNQTGRMMGAIEEILLDENPAVVLAQGDTNTVLAGILSAAKQNIPTGHVEAGLRSYDRRMPEEKNRVVCDVLSDYLFAPTMVQKEILLNEGVHEKNIFVVGNTIADAVFQHKDIADKQSNILSNLNVTKKKYVLFTAHRSLNVDDKTSLKQLIAIIDDVSKYTGLPILYPMHPRTKAKLDEFNLKVDNAQVINPLGYLDFLKLEMNASIIITDSGGVQEEACLLQVPCITIRDNTERPETVEVGANRIVGLDSKKMREAIDYFHYNGFQWENPFGDGDTAEKIIEVVALQQLPLLV